MLISPSGQEAVTASARRSILRAEQSPLKVDSLGIQRNAQVLEVRDRPRSEGPFNMRGATPQGKQDFLLACRKPIPRPSAVNMDELAGAAPGNENLISAFDHS
jgi:hypothetical protein